MRPTQAPVSDDEDLVIIDNDQISNYNMDNILPESPATIAELRAWLKPTEYNLDSGEYRKHLASRLEGTGAWLTESEEYRQWHNGSEDGLLWIKGIPGSGKSVVAASLIENFATEGVPVLFFFFRQIIDANHRPVNLLRDWLDQVLVYSPPLQVVLKSYVEKKRSLESVSIQDLWNHLRTALAQLPLVYCVADALDEMDHKNDEFTRCLADLGHWRPARVKVLMTSRPVAAVEDPMRRISYVDLRMDERFVDVDIATYVRHALEHSSISKENQELIRNAVPGRANGLFLYAKLTMDAFLEPNADIPTTLGKLPLDLNDMYSSILEEHARRSGIPESDQLRILQWVTHAFRPLRLLELADLIKTTVSDKGQLTLKANKDLVRTACGPLLEILPDETISVVHHSLTEFLIGATRSEGQTLFPVLQRESTHCELAVACLTYMTQGCLEGDDIERRFYNDPVVLQQRCLQFPFSRYAATNWYRHAASCDERNALDHLLFPHIDRLLSGGSMRSRWIELCWRDISHASILRHEGESKTNLHLAAFFGLSGYLSRLIERDSGCDIDVLDSTGMTPMGYAIYGNHLSCARILLQAGASPDPPRVFEMTTLYLAASLGSSEFVKLLLGAAADPKTPTNPMMPTGQWDTEGAVLKACANGHLDCVEALLPHISKSEKQLALHWAVDWSRSAIVERLLQDPDIDPNHTDKLPPPLLKAAFLGNEDLVEALLAAGADPSAQRTWDFPCVGCGSRVSYLDLDAITPLGALYILPEMEARRRQRCLSLLLHAGADVNPRERDGMSPLLRATSLSALKSLTDAGADPNSENDKGQTALHLLKFGLDQDCLRFLVEMQRIDINKKDSNGNPPIFSLILNCGDFFDSTSSSFKFAQKLLEHKPDLKARNNDGEGILHVAFSRHFLSQCQPCETKSLVRAFLEAGADPNLKDIDGETPLHRFASRADHRFNEIRDASTPFVEILQLLIQHGADINARDSQGRTPAFSLMASLASFETNTWTQEVVSRIDAFCDTSLDWTLTDRNGRTVLHEFMARFPGGFWISEPKVPIISRLVAAGVSPLTIDLRGNTILHEFIEDEYSSSAARPGSLDYLVQLGLDIDQPNYAGETPLHVAFRRQSGEFPPQSLLLARSGAVNSPDLEGVRPIHYAASAVQPLLECLRLAGADPFVSTWEQRNVLHIAARCRRVDNLGRLLFWMDELDTKRTRILVNQMDADNYTPLHYACRSALPEAVSLLLEFGAEAEPSERSNSQPYRAQPWYPPILQCVFCKQEQRLWMDLIGEPPRDKLLAPGVAMDPKLVCFDDHQTTLDKALGPRFRLERNAVQYEEIVQLLLDAKGNVPLEERQWSEGTIWSAIEYAADDGNDDAVELLSRIYERIPEAKPLPFYVQVVKARREAEREALREALFAEKEKVDWALVERYLVDNQYSSLTDRVEIVSVLGCEELRRLLAEFATRGFSHLVDNYCSTDDEELELLLPRACRANSPNMSVLRVLVEKKGASDLNAGLRALAVGLNWWQGAQGIPYLVSKGGDLEHRSSLGETPLIVALNARSRGSTKALLALGADANAVDMSGMSCLAHAGSDEELVQLLLSHGAKVNLGAIERALFNEMGGNSVLNTLLSVEGLSAALAPRNRTLEDYWARPDGECDRRMDLFETPLLVHAAGISEAIMEALLRAGAAPVETYLESFFPSPGVYRRLEDSPPGVASKYFDNVVDEGSVSEKTVSHKILGLNGIWRPILEWEGLDLETRDAAGRTLFLSANRLERDWDGRFGPKGLPSAAVATLLELGADPFAVDRDGRNALHHLLGSLIDVETKLARLTQLEHIIPGLINKPDNFGYYPLHYVLGRWFRTSVYSYYGGMGVGVRDEEDNYDGFMAYVFSHGVDATVVDDSGNGLLHYLACGLTSTTEMQRKTVSDLFAKFARSGHDVNARNKAGQTPVHLLLAYQDIRESWAKESFDGVLALLCELGVDWHARDNKGRNLLHVFASKYPWAFEKLIGLGLDPWAEDAEGRTSLDLAATLNHKILDMFKEGEHRENGAAGKCPRWLAEDARRGQLVRTEIGPGRVGAGDVNWPWRAESTMI